MAISKTIKGLTIKIGGDTSELGKAINEAEEHSKSLSKELGEVNKLLKLDPDNVKELTQKQQILTDAVGATSEKLNVLKEAEAQVQAQFEKGEITAAQMRAFQREIMYTENTMKGYEKAIAATVQQLNEAKVKHGEEASSLDMLRAKVTSHEKELAKLNDAYQNAVLQYGKNSEEAKQLEKRIKSLSAEHKDAKSKLSGLEDAARSVTSTEKTLTEKLDEQKRELERLKKEYINTAAQYGKNSTEAKELKQNIRSLSEEIEKEEKAVKDASDSLDNSGKSFLDLGNLALDSGKMLDMAAGAVGGFVAALGVDILQGAAGAIGNIGNAINSLALDVLREAAGLVKEIGQDVLETGMGFESAMSKIAATQGFSTDDIINNVDGAADKMDMLTKKAREMGAATSFSAEEAAEGLNILLMSGYSAAEAVSMIEPVLHEAEAGGMSIADAASYVSGSMKGFKKQTEEFNDVAQASAYYADLMSKGATLAATSVPELGQALSESAAIANTYKQSADSVTVALLRLAEQGEVGSGAATALNAAMKNLYSPTDTAKKALDQLGVSAYDEKGRIRDFNVVVDELAEALNSLDSDEERNALENAIFGIQGQAAFDKMIVTSGDKLQEFYDGIADANGSAALQSETMLDNLEGDISKLSSAWSDLELNIYNGNNAPLREVVQLITSDVVPALSDLVNGVDGADEEVSKALYNLAATALQKLTDLAPEAFSIGGKLILSLIKSVLDMSPQLLNAGFDIVEMLVSGILDASTEVGESFATAMGRIAPILADRTPELIETITTSFYGAYPLLMESALKVLTAIVNAIPIFAPSLAEAVRNIVPLIVETIVTSSPELTQGAIELFNAILDAYPALRSELAPLMTDVILMIAEMLENPPPELSQAAMETFAIILKEADALGPKLMAILAAIILSMAKQVKDAVEIELSVTNLLDKIMDTVNQLPDEMRESGYNIAAGLVEGILNAGDWVRQQVTRFANSVLDSILNTFDIHSPSKKMAWIGQMADRGLAEGFEDHADEPLSAIRQMSKLLMDEAAVLPDDIEAQYNYQAASAPTQDTALLERLDRILSAVERGHIIAIDGNRIVSVLLDPLDEGLARKQMTEARGDVG